jgi:hypothetical protein
MDRRIKVKRPTSLDGLEQVAREVWSEITPEVLTRLIERLPNLCKAVITAEGGYFNEKYAPEEIQTSTCLPVVLNCSSLCMFVQSSTHFLCLIHFIIRTVSYMFM